MCKMRMQEVCSWAMIVALLFCLGVPNAYGQHKNPYVVLELTPGVYSAGSSINGRAKAYDASSFPLVGATVKIVSGGQTVTIPNGSDFTLPSTNLPIGENSVTASAVGFNNADTDTKKAYLVKAVIKRNGTPITGTQNVIVGEMMNLSVTVEGAPAGTTWFPTWTVPTAPDTVKDWQGSQNSAIRYDLQQLDEKMSEISFAWVTGGNNRPISCNIDIPSVTSIIVSANFNVTKPSATGRIDMVRAGMSVYYDGVTGILSYGRPTKRLPDGTIILRQPGFTIHNVEKDVVGGDLQFVQVVNSANRRMRLGDGTWLKLYPTSGGDAYPYPKTLGPDPNSLGPSIVGDDLGLHAEDSPAQRLVSDGDLVNDEDKKLAELTLQDSYTMWVMFKPEGINSIWVPLMSVDWGYTGSAKLDNGAWVVGSVAFTSTGPIVTKPTSVYPEWTNFVLSGNHWQ